MFKRRDSKKKKTFKKKKINIKAGNLILDKLPGYFLIVCLLISFALLFYILIPFLTVIFLAAVLTIAFYPLYKVFLKFLKGRNRGASLISCFLVVIVILAPIAFFTILLVDEAQDTYLLIVEKVESGDFDNYLLWGDGGFFYDLKVNLESTVWIDGFDIKGKIISIVTDWSDDVGNFVWEFGQGLSTFLIGFLVMFFSMYYFFKDGDELVRRIGYISPLPSEYEEELFGKIVSMVKAIVFGVFFTALLQGLSGGIGFAIVGLPSPVFWGTVMAFLSLLPVFGTALVWGPAVIILLILGDYMNAIFLLIWGVLVVGSVDNFVRPYLIGGKAHTYPLMTFFVILGGVFMMGPKGVIVGPLILMLLMSFLHIYEREYSKVLKK